MAETDRLKNSHSLLMSITNGWISRIRASEASEARKNFMKTGSMCNQFFAGALGFMWDDKFRNDFLGGMPAPKFKITIAKAYELVTLYGPSVMWDYGARTNKVNPPVELPRLAFGLPDDPNAEEKYQQHLEDVELQKQLAQTRCLLMDKMLNYLQREQPGGGLLGQSYIGITDAIVWGRGCMHTETYKFPGSDRTLVRTRHFPVTDLYLDPSCRDPYLTDCYWVARKRIDTYWNVERKYKLPKDSLKKHCSLVGITQAAMNAGDENASARARGEHNNMITYYEIWSKEGIGIRHVSDWGKSPVGEKLEEIVGDHAHLVVAEGVNYPLNYPPHVMQVASDEEIKQLFDWEIPFYTDGRWPISFLDFHRRPDCAWPIAPMGMGLGELVVINVIMSVLAERCVEACRSNIVASQSLGPEILNQLKSIDHSGVLEVQDDVFRSANGDIRNLIAYIQSPGVVADVYKILELAIDSFERRTGLVDLMYGANAGGKVDRSATDSANKQQAVSIRPDWMGRQAEQWLTDIANNERIAVGWTMPGEEWVTLLGSDGAAMWDQLIYNEDPEVFVRQMRTTLEANSIKKPNKFRDNQNLQQTLQYIMPVLQQHWTQTGDPAPLNAYIKSMADAMEQDPTAWLLPEVEPPQPSPEEQAAAQMEQEKQALALDSTRENLKGKQLRNSKLEQEVSPPVPMEAMGMPPMGDLPPELPPEMAMPEFDPSMLMPPQ